MVVFSLSLAVLASRTASAQEPPAAPAPAASAAPAVKRAIEWKQFHYTCEGGAKLRVYLNINSVKVVFKDNVYLMRQTPSASGTRYSDGKVVWWSKGDGGFLQADTPDGDGEMIVKGCELDKPLNAEAIPGSVTGTVGYLVRMALPPSAVIEVSLEDVSRVDAPATVVAEEKIVLGDRQVPVAFELKFDPAKIDARYAYSVSARILVDHKLRFINDKAYPVLTRGNPTHIEMILKQASPGSPRNQ